MKVYALTSVMETVYATMVLVYVFQDGKAKIAQL